MPFINIIFDFFIILYKLVSDFFIILYQLHLESIETNINIILQLTKLTSYYSFHRVRQAKHFIILFHTYILSTYNTHYIKRLKQSTLMQKSLNFHVHLTFVLVLIDQAWWNYFVVNLAYNGDQEVKQYNHIEQQIEEPEDPDRIYH